MTPEVRVVANIAAAAEYVVAALQAALADGAVATLVLAGGATPLPLYARLAEAADLDWPRIHVFWGDERLVPPDDPGSNYAAAHEALLRHVSLPEANIHRIKGELEDVAAVTDYAEQLRGFAQRYDADCPSPWPHLFLFLFLFSLPCLTLLGPRPGSWPGRAPGG